jgi:phage terminase small subunit
VPEITMSRPRRTCLKLKLAAALAVGKSSAEWANANGVAERTAQRWANEPEVRAEVESIRRGTLDRAVGRMSNRVPWAIEEIAGLAKDAKSEAVKLAALRSILTDMLAVSDFTGLEERITKLEEQDRVRHQESTSCPG